MFLFAVDIDRKPKILSREYRGVVLDNNDPDQRGRIKLSIPELWSSESSDILPWAFPEHSAMLGGRQDATAFCVPLVGSEVMVRFPFEDVYAPVYFATRHTEFTHKNAFNEDYPNTYGFLDPQGTGFRVNLAKRVMEILHGSGASQTVLADGTIEFRTPSLFRIVSEDDASFIEFDLNNGSMKIGNKAGSEFTGPDTKVSSEKFTIDTGTIDERVGGAKSSNVIGGYKQVIGGSYSESIVSNKGISVGGNQTEIITQLLDQTIGLGITRTIVAGGVTETIIAGGVTRIITAGNYTSTVVAGTMDFITGAGALGITSGLSVAISSAATMTITSGAALTITAAAKTETLASWTVTSSAAITLTAGAAMSITSSAAITITAGATLTATATGIGTFGGATTNLGLAAVPANGALGFLSNPVVDTISGAPSVPSATVFLSP